MEREQGGGVKIDIFFISGVTSILATLYFVHSVPPQFKMDLFQQFYLLPLFYFVSCMHIRYSTRNWTVFLSTVASASAAVGSGVSGSACRKHFGEGEREREREGHSRHDDGTGSRRRRRRRRRRRQSIEVVRKVGRRHLFPSELKSVSQSVGYAGRQAGEIARRVTKTQNSPCKSESPLPFLKKEFGLSLFLAETAFSNSNQVS